MDWSAIIGGAAEGLTSGPIGLVFGGAMAYFKKKQSDKHELSVLTFQASEENKKRTHDLALSQKEIDGDLARGAMSLESAKFTADTGALASTSANQDKEITGLAAIMDGTYLWVRSLFIAPLFAIVTAAQKSVRIVVTAYLVIMTHDLFTKLSTIVNLNTLPQDDLLDIYKLIIATILNLAGMAVGFWFVSRFDGKQAKSLLK